MNTISITKGLRVLAQKLPLFCAACVGFLFVANQAAAQTVTTNALDYASDVAYTNDVAPNGLSPGGENGGTGFGAWTFTVNVSGGAFLAGYGPDVDPNDSFDIWNNAENANTIAIRPFDSALTSGESFSVLLRLNGLDGSLNTNMLALEDASGNILFSYFHLGGDNLNGHYTDATTTNGVAVNFPYDYQSFDSFTFTLDTPTNYTFTDNTHNTTVTGVISNDPIAQVAFIRGNGAENPSGGQDFQFDALQIVSTAGPIPPTFVAVTPAPSSLSVPTNTPISAQVLPGGAALSSNRVTLTLDGVVVTPAISSGSGNSLNISYQPATAFGLGTFHSVKLVVVDAGSNSFTNAWNFTTAFGALPATLPGPYSTSNAIDIIAFSTNDTWVSTNYDANSSKTLYVSWSAAFTETNSAQNFWGGLDFYDDNTEQLLVGKNGSSFNWSTAYEAGNEPDIPPYIEIVTNDWHKFVVRLDYSPGAATTVNIWLDPDLTQPEVAQPTTPLNLSVVNTFNNIRLRCGGTSAVASYSNVTASAQSPFARGGPATFQGYLPGQNAAAAPLSGPISVEVVFGTYGVGTNNVTLNLDGVNVTPSFVVASNALTVSYQPNTPFAPGSSHTVTVTATDSNGTPYYTAWSFTVDAYPTLPVVLAGPFIATTGNDIIPWTSQNGWIGTNYGPNSSATLYGSFSMEFDDINGETGAGGGFGGLEFYLGSTQQFLLGNNWNSTNWSVSVETGSTADIPPVTPIVLESWHVIAVKSVYHPGTNADVEVWLDPDFTKSESAQPNAPLALSINNAFDNIHLRAGNGSAQAEFTNIVFAATAQGVGFAAGSTPGSLALQTSAGTLQLSWTGGGTLQSASSVAGPWTDTTVQTNPQTVSTSSGSAQFFRLRQ